MPILLNLIGTALVSSKTEGLRAKAMQYGRALSLLFRFLARLFRPYITNATSVPNPHYGILMLFYTEFYVMRCRGW